MKEDQAAASQKRILRVEEGRVLGERALCGIGFSSEEARIITDHLIDAALCGYDFAGLPRILTIAEDPRTRQARRQSCFHWGRASRTGHESDRPGFSFRPRSRHIRYGHRVVDAWRSHTSLSP